MKKGFERLRHIAVASSMGLGLLGGGNACAATITLPKKTLKQSSATWNNIKNTLIATTSSTSSSAVPNFTTTNGNAFNSLSFPSSSLSTGAFAINNASLSNGLNNGFRGALYMVSTVSGSAKKIFENPDNTVDLTGDTTGDRLTTDLVPDFTPGINAQIEYFFYSTRPLVRALYRFTNITNNPLTFDVLIGGNLGSGSSTIIQATSDGNTNVDTSDLWLISNNKTLGSDPTTGDTPVITISRFGSTDLTKSPANGVTLGIRNGSLKGTFGHRYTLTVTKNSTARILVFAELNKTIAEAKACALDFETLGNATSAKLLNDLTLQQLSEIVNYDTIATSASTPSTCAHPVIETTNTSSSNNNNNSGSSSGSNGGSSNSNSGGDSSSSSSPTKKDLSTGALDPVSLATLLALLGLARVRKKESS